MQMFKKRTFYKGESCFHQNRVLYRDVDPDGSVYAEVSGSNGDSYELEVNLTFGPGGRLFSLNGTCSCPVAYNCEHVVAATLSALPELTGRCTSDPLSGVRTWLQMSPKRDGTADGSRRHVTGASGATGERLVYVIRNSQEGPAEIVPFRAYIKKNGEFGVNSREYRYASNAVTPKSAFLTVEDIGLLAKLSLFTQQGRYMNSGYMPEADELGDFVREVVETGRAYGGELKGPALSWASPRKASVGWSHNRDGTQTVSFSDAADPSISFLRFPVPMYLDSGSGKIGKAETGVDRKTLSWLSAAPAVPPESAHAVAKRLSGLGKQVPPPKVREIKEIKGLEPVPSLRFYGQHVEERLMRSARRGKRYQHLPPPTRYPCVDLALSYEDFGKVAKPGIGSRTFRSVGSDEILVIHRDKRREQDILQRLKDEAILYRGGPPRVAVDDYNHADCLHEADIVFPPASDGAPEDRLLGLMFASHVVPRLRDEGWKVEIDDSWPFDIHDGPVTFSTSLERSGDVENDWFSFSLKLEADGQEVEFVPLILEVIESLPLDEFGALREGDEVEDLLAGLVYYVALPSGSHVMVEGERIAPFVEAFLEAQGLFGFHAAEATRATELASALEGSGAVWKGGKEILQLGERLRVLSNAPEARPPAALNGELRPYQKVGYGWLRALSESGFGGALSDDMGLGKTVQALALLAHLHLERNTDRPSLLIVPTSLIGNWQREIARFVPDLKSLVLHGPGRRALFEKIPDHHLIITTYPLIIRDHGYLFKHGFELAILDEAQNVKNPAAATSKRIREIDARYRLALTGTPMENNLEELWALYDWLIPGLLGNRKSFNSAYRKPIEQKGDLAKQRLLSTRIKPFLMRRSKDEVADDLPSKTVMDELIPLEGDQRALYESIRVVMDERVRKAVMTKGIAGSRITIIDALLKLRQVCCDPELVKLDAARKVSGSAKRGRLLQLLKELDAEGRKVLVFSQFVEMLRLIESDIASRGWNYAMLHGRTKDRDRQVSRFQDGDARIFLISLKAGGVGLNLTAADTVILYDPWWNPATERQAMDRAHRIGQDKPVFVHRMIAEGTVETAIQQMQKRKQALSDALFEGTGDGPLALTEQDIDTLFAAAA